MRPSAFSFPTSTLRTIIRTFPKAFRGYSIKIILLALLGFLTGLFEGIGITALIPLFNFFDGSSRAPVDFISGAIEQFLSFIHVPFTLPAVLIFIVALFILKFGVSILHGYIATRIYTGYQQRTVDNLFKSTLKADWPYLLKQRLGLLETLIKVDAQHSSGMLQAISTLLMICASLLAYFLVAINISETVTFAALLFGAVVLVLYKPLFSLIRRLSEKVSQMNVDIAHHVNENILGIKTIKSLGGEEKAIYKGRNLFEQMRNLQLRLAVLVKIMSESIQPLGIIFITFIIAFAFYRTSYNLGALAALIYLIQRIFQYTQSIHGALQSISTELPYVENVTSHLKETKEMSEDRYTTGKEPFAFKEEIVFKSVSFSYVDRQEVLHSNSFTVKKGEMVGFIGPSGAGKTTIFDLLLRFLRPTGGEILIDGNNIDSITISDWRKNISYVSQDVFILNDTVLNNIKFFDDSITKEDIVRAAKLAQIYDFIETLPNKFDTAVGERGALFSAGQRQRIALARALARKPDIILLDEATSALDSESEQKIQIAIENLKGDMTILVIAHRLSTVLNADKLIVIENGKIMEEGSPHSLLKDKETYFHKVYNLRK